jgi:hypothetical protein
VEERATFGDGRVEWVSTTKLPFRDKDGNIVGTFGVSRNISARKRAEEGLARLQQRPGPGVIPSSSETVAGPECTATQRGRRCAE